MRQVAVIVALVVGLVVGAIAMVGARDNPNDFDSVGRALSFLASKPRCRAVECLNRRINRLEFLIRDLFKDVFVCTVAGPPQPDGSRPLLYEC